MNVYTNLQMYSESKCMNNDKCVEKSSSLNDLGRESQHGRPDVSKLCNQNRLKIMIDQKFKVVDTDKDLKLGHNFWKEVAQMLCTRRISCCKRCRYLQD